MMSRHFRLSSELAGAIAKRLPHSKNQPSAPGSFFNQFVTDIYIYKYIYFNRVLIVRIVHYVERIQLKYPSFYSSITLLTSYYILVTSHSFNILYNKSFQMDFQLDRRDFRSIIFIISLENSLPKNHIINFRQHLEKDHLLWLLFTIGMANLPMDERP